jgi:HEAT repeat protein
MKNASNMMTLMLKAAAVLVIPASAIAQMLPTPPTPPAPPTPPTAVVAPAPLAPKAPIAAELYWPGFPAELVDLAELERNMAGVQVMTAEHAREISRQAMEESRRAMEAGRVAMADARIFEIDGMHWADMQNVFTTTSASSAYDSGLSLMSRRDYEKAIARFDQVITAKGTRADGALYHKAYALYRLGRSSDATNALADLRKSHPQSRYLKDASALETAIRASNGQPVRPEAADDEEIKLLAINALQHSDPERALPLLENVLNNGANPLPLKIRALYVLAQSSQPRAKEILMSLAKGGGNPDLQRSAISYLASRGKTRVTSAELKEIYDSTSDPDIKRAVISAWGTLGDMPALAAVAAAGTADKGLRTTALNRMTDPAAADTLWAIYQKESDKELRLSILSRLGSLGSADRLMDVVRSEKDAEVRRRAIRSLGNMRVDKSGALLSELYGRETDADNKKAIITALSGQQNGEALVAIARKESDMAIKRDIVQRLSGMTRNKAAMDYMAEILK